MAGRLLGRRLSVRYVLRSDVPNKSVLLGAGRRNASGSVATMAKRSPLTDAEKTAQKHQVDLVVQGLRGPLADMAPEHARKLVQKALVKLGVA